MKNIKYQTNPARLLHRDFYSQVSNYEPEYKRLNVEPAPFMDVSKDFMNNKFKRGMPRQPPRVQVQAVQTQQPNKQQAQIRMQPQVANLSGRDHDNLWANPGGFDDSSVPSPPVNQFSNETYEHVDRYNQQQYASPHQFQTQPQEFQDEQSYSSAISQANEGDYCVFIKNQLVFSTPSLEDADEALNGLIFHNQNPVDSRNITVMRKLTLKLGASIR